MTKSCIKCRHPKHLSHFGINSRAADGKNSTCKLCIQLRNATRDRTGERAALRQRKVAEMQVGHIAPRQRILQALADRSLTWRELETETGLEIDDAILALIESGQVREHKSVFTRVTQ